MHLLLIRIYDGSWNIISRGRFTGEGSGLRCLGLRVGVVDGVNAMVSIQDIGLIIVCAFLFISFAPLEFSSCHRLLWNHEKRNQAASEKKALNLQLNAKFPD